MKAIAAENVDLVIGRRHVGASHLARTLARWSAGAMVARWVFRDITISHTGHGLFASLNADARTGLACVAQVPIVLPLILFLFALNLNYGAFYTAVRETFLGAENRFSVSTERGVVVNRLMRNLPVAWRRWHIFGWWCVAALAGVAIATSAGVLLRKPWNAWLVWSLVTVVGWCVAKLEEVLTERPYHVVIPRQPVNPQEALRRAREWRELRPGDTSAMPWIYAYSGLSTEEIEEEFTNLGTSGPLGFTSKVLGFVMIVLFYSLLPAPDVSRFQTQGVTGCFFAIVHGFAGVAEENLGISIVAATVLIVLMPLSVLVAYMRFMVRYHFPLRAVAQVLARETQFATDMPLYSILMMTVMGLVVALVMWASAIVAETWGSPVAGTVVLAVPIAIIVKAVMRTKVRGPVPK